MAAVCSRPLQLISLFLSSFFFPPSLPHQPRFFLFFFCFTPKSIFLISSRIDLAISYHQRTLSRYLIWTNIALFLLLYLVFFICPALHFAAAAVNHFKWHSFALVLLLGNLCRHAEQRLDWTRLASLSARAESAPCIRCRRPAVYYCHSAAINVKIDYQPIGTGMELCRYTPSYFHFST